MQKPLRTLVPAAEIKDVVIHLKNGSEIKFSGIRSCEIDTCVNKEKYQGSEKIVYTNGFHIDITGEMDQ